MTRNGIAIAVALTLLTGSKALACSCACSGKSTLAQAVESASGVVVAEVVEKYPQTFSLDSKGHEWISSCGQETVRLRVKEVLKGQLPSEIFSSHANIGTGCDFKFRLEPGKSYVLFLAGHCLELNGCSPSLPFEQGAALIKEVKRAVGNERGDAQPPN